MKAALRLAAVLVAALVTSGAALLLPLGAAPQGQKPPAPPRPFWVVCARD